MVELFIHVKQPTQFSQLLSDESAYVPDGHTDEQADPFQNPSTQLKQVV